MILRVTQVIRDVYTLIFTAPWISGWHIYTTLSKGLMLEGIGFAVDV